MSVQNDMPSISEAAAVVKAAESAAATPVEEASVDRKRHRYTAPASPDATPVETPEADPPATPETPAPVKKDPDSSKFAVLSRKEKELRAREQRFQQQQKDWEKRQQEYEDRVKAAEARVDGILKGKRPLDVLKQAGFSYEQATQDVLGGYKPPEPDPLDQKLEPINEKLSKVEQIEQRLLQWEESLKQKENQQNYQLMLDGIKDTLVKGGERFEITAAMGQEGVDLIKDVMVEYYNEHSKLLTYEEAAQQVEEWYEQDLLAKLSQTKKVQSRFKPAEPEPKQPTKKTAEKTAPKTLTADMTSGGEATVDIDKMSPKEAIEYLAKRIKTID